MNDPRLRGIVLNLFTEVSILEHLLRNRLSGLIDTELSAGQFGVLNRFVRLGLDREGLSAMAWAFQDDEVYMSEKIASLVALGYAELADDADRSVSLTAAGRDAHERAVERMSPEVEPLLDGLEFEEVATCLKVIREFRRTLDNLPDR